MAVASPRLPRALAVASTIAVVAALALPSAARADAPTPPGVSPTPPSAPPPARGERYIGTMAATSALALVVAFGGIRSTHSGNSLAPFVVTSALYVATGPLVHGLRGRAPVRAGASLVLRVGLPIAGLYLNDCDCDDEGGSAMLGLLGGVAAATAIDIAMSAFPGRPKRSSVTPTVAAHGGTMTFGLATSF